MSTELTSTQFQVDLGQLSDAITTVRGLTASVSDEVSVMQSRLQTIASLWRTPSTASYEEIEAWFDTASTDLVNLLEEIVSRLQQAYDTYGTTEQTNVSNESSD